MRSSAHVHPLVRPIARLPYVPFGVVLFALKCVLDWRVSVHFERAYSPLIYVSPLDAPLFRRDEAPAYWLALWGVALPFLMIGCLLTVRRLRDAGLSTWFVTLFFVPFANLLFFAVCAFAPRRESSRAQFVDEGGAFRGVKLDATLRPQQRGLLTSVFLAGMLGAVIGLGAFGVSVGILRTYGSALMLGAPIVSGFATAAFFVRLQPDRGFGGVAIATLIAFILSVGATIGFAFEGAGCTVMALPLLLPVTVFGSFVGFTMARTLPVRTNASVSAPFVVLPLLFGADYANRAIEVPAEPIESIVVVDAPAEVVWQRVIAFPPLAPPDDFMFRHGIAAPLRATIVGTGVGAVRRCEFTTGTFVEPIEVWDPPRELAFSVRAQPDPMREETLWTNVRPPHLDGYLKTTRGQFALEALPSGKTRLIGRTWYRTGLVPEAYFRLWGDAIIHRIHLRVLRHVAALAEADVAASRFAPSPVAPARATVE